MPGGRTQASVSRSYRPRGGTIAEVGAERLVDRGQDLEQHEHRAGEREGTAKGCRRAERRRRATPSRSQTSPGARRARRGRSTRRAPADDRPSAARRRTSTHCALRRCSGRLERWSRGGRGGGKSSRAPVSEAHNEHEDGLATKVTKRTKAEAVDGGPPRGGRVRNVLASTSREWVRARLVDASTFPTRAACEAGRPRRRPLRVLRVLRG